MTMHSFLTLMFFSLSCFIISISQAINNGFSVELIHRDSLKSPLYQPTQNKYQRVASALRRSINRVNHLTNTPKSTVIPASGEFLMEYSVGTPPFKIYGVVDTGSDIVWLQCKPCEQCYNQTTPIFNPSKSSSYKNNIPCMSKKCKSFDSHSCSKKKSCLYTITYGDGSISQGDLSEETLTLDSTSNSSFSFPKILIGCGHKNTLSIQGQTSGVVGLGFGPLSLITQLGSSIGGKFSYCLGPESSNSTSKLNFGNAAVVSGHGVVSTPLVKKDSSIFYYLSLEAFSVGNKRVEFVENSNGGVDGNVFIDSGTTLTMLPYDVYNKLESAVVKLVKLKRVNDPHGLLKLCYFVTSDKYDFPIITAHFKNADVKLHPIGTFVPIVDGIMCFAFASTQNTNIGIFGNLAQQNLLVGYDLQQNLVSFKSTDCTKPY
ncbi:aspartic proteinase CDR1-like [Trifolium pratense]|uniref:aspartic proteinase CDR1-like n=1 Tax=Trifolium pratense TaxID=57577 RepID=UPI001E695E2D|nr:aspartic proteinase CDR1-like [Trifolium pratense]